MNITVTFRHIESTEAIKAHVEDKLEKFKKYLISPIDVHVILSVEKFRQKCEIILTSKHFRATAVETSENLYTSIDQAEYKLERQLKKHKEILKEHKHLKSVGQTAMMAEEKLEVLE